MNEDDHRPADLHERLLRLEARLQVLEARLESTDVGGPGPKYFESGSIHPELDDQSITP